MEPESTWQGRRIRRCPTCGEWAWHLWQVYLGPDQGMQHTWRCSTCRVSFKTTAHSAAK